MVSYLDYVIYYYLRILNFSTLGLDPQIINESTATGSPQ